MKRVSMMLLVLLAMSVQAPNAQKKRKTQRATPHGKAAPPYGKAYLEKDKLLTVTYAADYVKKDKAKKENKCQWSGNLRGTGQLEGPKIANPNQRGTRFFEASKIYRFQHLIGTSGDDGHERECIVWVGENSQLFEPKPGIRTSSSGYATRLAAKSAWGLGIFKNGPQLGASPKIWKWEALPKDKKRKRGASSPKSKGFAWQMNFVAAHVEIQEKNGLTNKWTSLGSWLIPTTKSSNSRTSRKCKNSGKKRKNPNKWQHLRNGAPVTAIKLKKDHSNCSPNDD